jgi:hypothetical protein
MTLSPNGVRFPPVLTDEVYLDCPHIWIELSTNVGVDDAPSMMGDFSRSRSLLLKFGEVLRDLAKGSVE